MIATQTEKLDIIETTNTIDPTDSIEQVESLPLAQLVLLIDQAFEKYDEADRTIERYYNDCLQAAKVLGEYLIMAKEQMQHGEWLPWVKANCKFSDSKARQCMTVARNWEAIEKAQELKSGSDPDLGLRGALALIRKPNADEMDKPLEQVEGELVEDEPILPSIKDSSTVERLDNGSGSDAGQEPQPADQRTTIHGFFPGAIAKVKKRSNKDFYGKAVQVIFIQGNNITFATTYQGIRGTCSYKDLKLLPNISDTQLLRMITAKIALPDSLATEFVDELLENQEVLEDLKTQFDSETLEGWGIEIE